MNDSAHSDRCDLAIETRELSRSFGELVAVDSVTLQVPRGSVFGLVGVNGAGKSTLIRMLMGHLRPSSGQLTVLGRSLESDLLEIRKRVGYVSENRYLYEWMTVEEGIRFTRAFHSNWDDHKADELLRRFGLPSGKKIKHLSRGNRARVCLLLALAFNPELIILDEPTSGLDPIVRRDFLENIVWEIGQEGRTVLFSSHIVEEIERIADYVTIIDNGQILTTSTVDALKSSIKRVRFATNSNSPDLSSLPGVLAVYQTRHEQVVTIQDPAEDLLEQFQKRGIEHPELLPMSLEEIFVDSVRAQRRRSGVQDGREGPYAS